MAAIDSPRHVLGERDVNTSLVSKASSTNSSPSKPASFSHNNALPEKTLDLGKLAPAFSSPKIHHAFPSPAAVDSPPGSRKRRAACLGDIQDGPSRKEAVIGLPKHICDENRLRTGNSEMRSPHSPDDDHCVRAAATETASDPRSLRRSLSPESSFDATQDSELLDSQITNITEPEDPSPLALPAATIIPLTTPRVFSHEEARENAEALRLRLKVAMYKVKTDQTDLPLSQLQIRSSKAHCSTRTLLPSSRLLAPAQPHSCNPATSSSTSHHPSPPEHEAAKVKSISFPSSSSPPRPTTSPDRPASHASLPTPLLPRSRDRNSHVHTANNNDNSRGSSPQPGPEATSCSSVVKGRAAAVGLLSLMGRGTRHD